MQTGLSTRRDIEKIDKETYQLRKEDFILTLIQKKAKNTMIEYGEKYRRSSRIARETPCFGHIVVKRLPQVIINHYLKIGWDIDLRICTEKGKTTYRYKFSRICHGVGIYTEGVFDEKYDRQFECV